MVKINNSVSLTRDAIPTEMLGKMVDSSDLLIEGNQVWFEVPAVPELVELKIALVTSLASSNKSQNETGVNRCRACLKDDYSVLQSLFDNLQEETIADVLSFCTGIEVNKLIKSISSI